MTTPNELYDEAVKIKDQGDLEGAVQRLEAAVALDPNFALAHTALGVYYGRLGQHAQAVEHARRAAELEPHDPSSYTALSVVCQRAGLIPEAEAAMARAQQIAAMNG